jgi:glucosamine-6-phosphate deaminase
MYNHFFSHIDIKPSNVHLLDGMAPDLEAECLAYEERITRAGGIELFMSGIGPDGHIAFNEPGSSLASRTRVKTLAYDTIQANSRFFNGDVDAVPKMALTVGIQTILDAREVLSIITGPHKSLALQKCIEEGVNHMWTLSSLQLHAHALIVCDEAATQDLKVKTVTYFKQIESVIASSRGAFTQNLPTGESVVKKRDSVKEKLDSPVDSVFNEDFGADGSSEGKEPLKLSVPEEVPIVRSPTPELRPDPMSSRIEKKNAFEQALAGLEPAEVGFERMGARIAAM